jgi:iron complex outermembrane receptor protein
MSGHRFACPIRIAGLGAALAGLLISRLPARAQTSDNGVLEQIFSAPVTSSATGRPQLVSEAPANIEIVTQDDIRRLGATTIPDALAFLPGVTVRRYGIADVDVGIRGYDQPYNARLLVLVNGREVFEEAFGHVAWADIPVQMDEIRQIEVIKGPNSALYGFNAVSGVINIITYDPITDDVNVATLRGGTQSYAGGSVVGSSHIGDTAGVRLSAGGLHSDDFAPAQLSDSLRNVETNPLIGSFNLDAKAHPASNVTLFLEASATSASYMEDIFVGAFDKSARRTNSFRAGGSIDTDLGLLTLSAYRNQTLLSINGVTAIGSTTNWTDQDLYVVQADLLSKPAPDHTIRVGLEYRNNAVTAPGFVAGTVGYQVYAASAMWNWQITPSIALTNAIRVDNLDLNYSGTPAPLSGYSLSDYNNATLTAVSFNTGLVWEATAQDTFRLMVARGVQLPSLVDFGEQAPFGTLDPVIVAGNPNLRPTIVHNLELDYDRSLPPWNTTLRTAVFAQRSDDIISQPFGSSVQFTQSGLPLLTATNVGSSEAFGGELTLKGQTAAGIRWNAGYALVTTTNHTTLNQGPFTTSAIDYALSVPRNVIDAGIGYTWEKLELDLQGRWQSSYLDYRPTGESFFLQPVEIHNYVTANARAGYKLNEHVTVALTAQQFNTSRLYQTAGPPIERRIIASLTARF